MIIKRASLYGTTDDWANSKEAFKVIFDKIQNYYSLNDFNFKIIKKLNVDVFWYFPFIFIIQKFSFIHSWLHKRFFITEKCLFKTIYFWNEPNKFIPNVIFLLVWISGSSGSEESVDSGARGSRSSRRRLTESESDFFPEFEVRVLSLPGRRGGRADVRLFDETLKSN